jgi:hypothetical protein
LTDCIESHMYPIFCCHGILAVTSSSLNQKDCIKPVGKVFRFEFFASQLWFPLRTLFGRSGELNERWPSNSSLVTHHYWTDKVKDVVAQLNGKHCTQSNTDLKMAFPSDRYDSFDLGKRITFITSANGAYISLPLRTLFRG